MQIDAPSALRIENNLARMVASADLQLRGTYDRPLLFGSAQIERGDVIFEGNRYLVTRGTIGFANPARIEPYFDIEAETRVRVPRGRGRLSRHARIHRHDLAHVDQPQFRSAAVVGRHSCCCSSARPRQPMCSDAGLRMLNPSATTRSEEDLLKAATARLLTGSLSAPVNRAVEQTLGVNLQITPSIGGSETDPLTPSARLILGKRLSNRAYVTFARPLGTASARPDSRARIRSERPARLGADARRRPHVLDRFPRAASPVMKSPRPLHLHCPGPDHVSSARAAALFVRRRADHRCQIVREGHRSMTRR